MGDEVKRDESENASAVTRTLESEMSFDPLREATFHGIVGQTASGKSALALEVAERAGAEIISLDSMQVYRGMDIGTAKPNAQERARVPHHMLDLVDPPDSYDVHQYLTDLRVLLFGKRNENKRLLFVGGTAFYLKALLQGLFEGPPTDHELRRAIQARLEREGNQKLHNELTRIDPRSAERIHPNDAKRLVRALEVYEQTGKRLSDWQTEWGWHEDGTPTRQEKSHRLIGLELSPEDLDDSIARRTTRMIDAGWPDEAVAIRDGIGYGPTSLQALGYSQILDHAEGRSTREQCEELIRIRTRQFARRQRTWYRKFDEIEWLYSSGRGFSEHHVTDALRLLGWDESPS